MKFFTQYNTELSNKGCHDCPIACLRCVLEHFGRETTRDALVNSFPAEFKKGTSEEGALDLDDLDNLRRVGDSFGFEVGDWIDFGELEALASLPNDELILIVLRKEGGQHAVVFHHLEEGGKINIMDPAAACLDFVSAPSDALLARDPVLLRLSNR